MSGCNLCPSCVSKPKDECNYLGQKQCVDDKEFVRGDMNGDGILSPREILRLFYIVNGGAEGASWGLNYADWFNMTVHECKLSGINCKSGKITKIDLRGATLCSKKSCEALPNEFGFIGESLEVLDLSGSFSNFAAISIPPSIGMLSNLKILDLSNNNVKNIPNEIGNLTTLQILNLSQCRYQGQIPSALWKLQSLEKLNLSDNFFSHQQFPSEIGMLTNIREFLMNRSQLSGTIPPELGNLSQLKGLEFYGNLLTGTIPSSFEKLTQLRKIDVFNNMLEGSVDFITKIPEIEIVHLKANKFSGTISTDIGKLQKLRWLDISFNSFSGKLPSTLGEIPVLKDLILGTNKFQPPVPSSLCRNTIVNGGPHGMNSCEHIACPVGKTSSIGHSKDDVKCEPCSKDETTLHLASSSCKKIGQYEYFTMVEALLHRKKWELEENVGVQKNECDLDIVNCNDDGQVMSFVFPLKSIKFNEQLFRR